jgi:hypothetical protein
MKAISPVEHSWKHRERTGSAKEGCGKVLTGELGPAEADSGHCWRVLKHLDVTCGTFAEDSSADWSAKAGCANVLIFDSCVRCTKLLKRLAIDQNSNVTCGTFAEAPALGQSSIRPRVFLLV